MNAPNSFRQPPKQPERLLPPEQSKAYNDALARQVDRAHIAAVQSRQHRDHWYLSGKGSGKLSWKYALPVVLGGAALYVGPHLGLDAVRSAILGGVTALVLVSIAFVQDAKKWMSK